ADLHLDVAARGAEGLGIGVHRDELDALQRLLDHPVDRVAAAAAHAEDLHPRVLRGLILDLEHHAVRHCRAPWSAAQKKSCNHRLTGPNTRSTAGEDRPPAPNPPPRATWRAP